MGRKKVIWMTILGALLLSIVLATFENKKYESEEYVDYTETMYIIPTDEDPVTKALGYYGSHERLWDGTSNPVILSFYEKFSGALGVVTDSKVAWCSAFLNSIFASCGYDYSGSLVARSWLACGIQVQDPQVGDVVVFWRESRTSWKGHVAMYISQDEDWIYVLGGNQSDQVKISAYPKSRLLEFRRMQKIVDYSLHTQYGGEELKMKLKLEDVELTEK